MTWTPEQQQAAVGEGWDIFESHNADGKVELQLQRDDDLNVFADDGAVWAHVWSKAQDNSKLHIAALAHLAVHSPIEYAKIKQWNEDRNVRAIIDDLPNIPPAAIFELIGNHPRLLTKVVDLIRAEYDDHNLSGTDILFAYHNN